MKYLENKKEIYDVAVALLYTDIIPDEQVMMDCCSSSIYTKCGYYDK